MITFCTLLAAATCMLSVMVFPGAARTLTLRARLEFAALPIAR